MLRQTNYGLWVDDDGEKNENEKAIDYIVECAKSVGIEVIPGKTALSICFIAEVLKKIQQESNRKFDDYEYEIESLQNRLDGAEYGEERLREEATRLEEKINALKQEPCEDCISRNEVLKLFATHDGKYLYEAIRDMDSVRDLTTDIKDKIIFRMWNCRSKKTPTIDKVKMETIICEEFANQEPKTDSDCIRRRDVIELISDIQDTVFGQTVTKGVEKLPSVNPQEPKIDRLYRWLNDMRLGIAPDETTPQDERAERLAQVDVIDDIMEWLEKNEQSGK